MKSRNNIFLLLALVFGLVLLAGCGGTKTSGDAAPKETKETLETMKPVTIKLADFLPNTHPITVHITSLWAKRVTEVTNGKVKVDFYPSGTLLKSGDIYEGVVSGVATAGHDVSGYNIGSLPVLNAMYVGGIPYKSNQAASNVARDIINEFKPKELQNTQLMYCYGMAPGVLQTTKPVKTLEDLKGMQIRASGANVDTLKALGAVPVGITVGETYDAMSKGVVDGALLPAESLYGFKLGEVSKYVIVADMLYNSVNYLTLNKGVWDSFPKEVQDAINKVNDEVFAVASKCWDGPVTDGAGGWDQKGLDYVVAHGGTINELTPEESARWKSKLSQLQVDYAKVLDGKGIDGKAVMKRIVELTDKYNALYPKNMK